MGPVTEEPQDLLLVAPSGITFVQFLRGDAVFSIGVPGDRGWREDCMDGVHGCPQEPQCNQGNGGTAKGQDEVINIDCDKNLGEGGPASRMGAGKAGMEGQVAPTHELPRDEEAELEAQHRK